MDTKTKYDQPKDLNDHIIEWVGWIAAILPFVLIFYYFKDLPNQIPIHFNAVGEPDDYGSKNMIYGIAAVGLAVYGVLFYLNKHPQLLNTPIKIHEENANIQFYLLQKMTRHIATICALGISYITYKTIMIGLGKAQELNSTVLILFLIALVLPILVYFIMARKHA